MLHVLYLRTKTYKEKRFVPVTHLISGRTQIANTLDLDPMLLLVNYCRLQPGELMYLTFVSHPGMPTMLAYRFCYWKFLEQLDEYR